MMSDMPKLPDQCTMAYFEGRANQGGEYRALANSYEPGCAMFSPEQMRAYAREHAAALQAEVDALRAQVAVLTRTRLTDSQIDRMIRYVRKGEELTGVSAFLLARAVETAHGIAESQGDKA